MKTLDSVLRVIWLVHNLPNLVSRRFFRCWLGRCFLALVRSCCFCRARDLIGYYIVCFVSAFFLIILFLICVGFCYVSIFVSFIFGEIVFCCCCCLFWLCCACIVCAVLRIVCGCCFTFLRGGLRYMHYALGFLLFPRVFITLCYFFWWDLHLLFLLLFCWHFTLLLLPFTRHFWCCFFAFLRTLARYPSFLGIGPFPCSFTVLFPFFLWQNGICLFVL